MNENLESQKSKRVYEEAWVEALSNLLYAYEDI